MNALSLPAFAAASPNIDWWPLIVLAIGLATIVILITKLKVHAFIALLLAAVLTGGLSGTLPGEWAPGATGKAHAHWAQAVELSIAGFGSVASKIGVVIALAAIIGVCLVESGGADKVVRRFLALLGESRAAHALFIAGYILSIPIFFETYFMLLLPLAQALHLRTGKNYMAFVLAICCGGTITHSLVAPHPGPLAMAENLHLEVGQTMLCGMLAGILPATCAWWLAQRIAKKVNAPMRETGGAPREDLEEMMARPESQLPSLTAALTPVVLPLILIAMGSLASIMKLRETSHTLYAWIEFFGDRHVALLIGAGLAMALVMRQRKIGMGEVNKMVGPRFAEAGVIILIASAGGAFGAMLRHAGVGEVSAVLAKHMELNLVFLGWAISAVIRVAQGSATVAMITASAIMYPILQAEHPPYHPMYVFLAIGFGSKMISWMNDSGFWTVSKLSGFTESETLKSWTILVTVGSLIGLAQCLVLSKLLPFAS